MGLSGPVGRYLLLQQLSVGVDIAVSGSGFRGNDLAGSLYVNGSVALRLNRFLRSRLVRLRRDGLVRCFAFIHDTLRLRGLRRNHDDFLDLLTAQAGPCSRCHILRPLVTQSSDHICFLRFATFRTGFQRIAACRTRWFFCFGKLEIVAKR